MSYFDRFFNKANELLHKPGSSQFTGSGAREISNEQALRWRHKHGHSSLESIQHSGSLHLDDLKCIDKQKRAIDQNTRQFLHGLPANNVLLWGPRGTGKSSVVKAIFNAHRDKGLKLIEVEKERLTELHDICDAIRGLEGQFIIFCDDLSFESSDPSYKALKVILDGSISTTPDNILIYATSNRRHLMPEYMSENKEASIVEGELHLGETTEEKISLSERFGLWLAFHPFNQNQYLEIVNYWINKLEAPVENKDAMQKEALKWALQHGSRSGRTAWQFARDWTGRKRLEELEA